MHRLYMLALPPVLLLACFGTCVWAEGPIPEEGFKDLLASPAETWRGYHKPGWPEGWKLEDGVLHRLGGGDDLMTKKDFADFDLRLEWKIAEGGNSGIIYRASDGQDAPYWTGPEYQLLDDQKHHDGKNHPHLDRFALRRVRALRAGGQAGGAVEPDPHRRRRQPCRALAQTARRW